MIGRARTPASTAVRITGVYLLAATVWILASDRIVDGLPHSVQSVKGLAFVVVTAGVLFAVLVRDLGHREALARLLEQERAASEHLFAATPEPAWVFDAETLRFLAVNDATIARYGWTADEFRAMTIMDIRPPDERERLGPVLRTLTPEHRDFGRWRHRTKDGRVLDVHISAHGVVYDGRPAELVIARDESDLVREEEARLTRHRRQVVLAALSTLALAEPALQTLFARACAAIVAEPGFAGAAVIQLDGDRRVLWAIEGEWTGADATAVLPLESSSWDRRVTFAPGAGDTTLLFAPIVGRVEAFGAIVARANGSVDEDATLFVESLANVLGTAVVRRETSDALALAEEAERQRISEDIHDDPLQLLIAVAMRLQVMRRRHADPELRAELDSILVDERRAIERLRMVMFELHPQGIDDGGLAQAFEHVLERVATGETTYSVDDHTEVPIPASTAAILFRSAREAILNVGRHANARHIEVTITPEDEGTTVRVRDDGDGFEIAGSESRPGHLGLVTMRARVARAGGRTVVRSEPGGGTTVELWIPHRSAGPPGVPDPT
ncbi:MAG TPA: PAS domain-containing sensor histidine kinase [Acidimicrobiia bacterium]|nr:PAS domain-containing sensor histidine kinase [Acidimicrobiia bacterium]